jgi:probable HAF family extracellular repeat protein
VLVDGRYSDVQPPGPSVEIFPSGMNNNGQIAGEYIRLDGDEGFVRDARGTITPFDVPEAEGTEAAKINDRGQVVGRYSEDTPFVEDSTRVRGFVRLGDDITKIDFPRARHTLPTGINDLGHVVGYYVDGEGDTHGFLWRDERFTTIDFQGATAPTPVDINDRGDVVGLYVDAMGATHGFLLSDGRYRTIEIAGVFASVPTGINDRGQIVGYTANDADLTPVAGFLLPEGPGGPATPIEVPGTTASVALDINDAGHVVGLQGAPEQMVMAEPASKAPPAVPANGELATVRGITVSTAIATQIDQLVAAAEADGLALTGSGYRDRARQIELRRAHCGNNMYAIYMMPASQCSPPTARPGTSMHERGLAIDFSCDGELIRERSNPCFVWLAEHAASYGLWNLPSERWHWSTNGR